MKKILFFTIILLPLLNIAQPWRGNNAFLDDVLENYPDLDSGKIYYQIPLSIHIYLNPREDKTFLNNSLKSAVANLNSIYSANKTGIKFYISDIFYYSDNQKLKVSYISESYFASRPDHNPYSINIYYVNALEKKLFGEKFYRGTYNHISNSIIIIRHASRTTLAHEIGHYLGLLHPHRNYNKGKLLQEPVSRQRRNPITKKRLCETRGDYLSDTPAEPALNKHVNKNCKFADTTLTDDWGDVYHPHCNNIMSYLPYVHCRKKFTRQQRAVMLYTASKKQKHNYWEFNNSQNLIFNFDDFEPDDAMSMASQICPNKIYYHTFHYVVKKSNKKLCNSVDWIKFKLDTSKQIKLKFSETEKYAFPKLDLTMLNKKQQVVYSNTLLSPTTVNLTLSKGEYFLKIEKISASEKILTAYKLQLITD